MTVAKDTVPIWGAGAIGGTIGAYLARASIPVKLVDLVADHVDAMNAQGHSIKGAVDTFTIHVDAATPERLTGTFGKVLLCVKGQDTADAAEALLPHLAEDGHVVSVQNGLNEDTLPRSSAVHARSAHSSISGPTITALVIFCLAPEARSSSTSSTAK